MADTGWLNPSSVNGFIGDYEWESPDNIKAFDTATANYDMLNGSGDMILAEGFGAEVPTGSTIDKIEARFYISCDFSMNDFEPVSTSGYMYFCKDYMEGDASSTIGMNYTQADWTIVDNSTDSVYSSWSSAEVNSSTFGIAFTPIYRDASPGTDNYVKLDSIQVKITYTEGGGGIPNTNYLGFF